MDEEVIDFDFDEIEFNGKIRAQVICLLLFIFFYSISFWIIQYFKTKTDSDELYAGDEDFFVYRISVWMCTCSLAVSIGAVFLLPISVLGTEVLHAYPDNFYLKWFNWSLINSLWSYVFLLSNISLFFLLPFAYFFIESQGFGFSFQQRPKPFLSRVYETICVCILMIVIVVCLAHVFYSLFLSEKLSVNFSIFNLSGLSIPLVYSFGSLVGVFLLLLSAPLGFATMFDDSSKMLFNNNKDSKSIDSSSSSTTSANDSTTQDQLDYRVRLRSNPESPLTRPGNGPFGDYRRLRTSTTMPSMLMPTVQQTTKISRIRRVINASAYPLVILALLLLTGITISIVLINTLQLLFGFRVLPGYVQFVEVHSRHTFGITGAVVESIIIMYIMFSALFGVYSIPLLRRMRPVRRKTSMTCVIANCTTVLLLSSALPVLARTLGITSFDLLGSYGRLNWISNFSLVWCYNLVFAAASTFSILIKFTEQVRRELRKRMRSLYKKDESEKKTN